MAQVSIEGVPHGRPHAACSASHRRRPTLPGAGGNCLQRRSCSPMPCPGRRLRRCEEDARAPCCHLTPNPCFHWSDWAITASLALLLPRAPSRWSCVLRTPEAIGHGMVITRSPQEGRARDEGGTGPRRAAAAGACDRRPRPSWRAPRWVPVSGESPGRPSQRPFARILNG